MADWAWVICGTPTSGVGDIRRLTHAYGRRVTWRVDAPCDAEFSLSANIEEIFTVVPMATDLKIYRDGVLLFRGRIGTINGTLNKDGHAVQFSAVDYRGLLNRRIIPSGGLAYASTDQAAIAWNLITLTQALPGGNLGITNGAGASSGQLRDRNYDAGKPLGDAIAELGRVDNGFEWEIDPTLALNRYYPLRGVDNNYKFDYSGNIKSVAYQFNPDDFANSTLVTGSETTVPVTNTAATIATDPRGRFEKSGGYPSIIEQTTLNARGLWYLGQTDTIRYSYHVTLTKGVWNGPSDFWYGDTIHPNFQNGWLQEYDLTHRVVEIQAVLDGDGNEEIDCGILALGAGDSNANSILGLPTAYADTFDETSPEIGGSASGGLPDTDPLTRGILTEAGESMVTEDGDLIVWE